MNILFVVSHLRDWPGEVARMNVVHARKYLTDPAYAESNDTRVFNLCSSYLYQGRGYYVSLLAEARGHRPLPDVKAIADIASGSILKSVAESLDELIQSAFAGNDEDEPELRIFFGRHPDGMHEKLCEQLFNILLAPLLKVRFARSATRWLLQEVTMLHLHDLDDEERSAMRRAAEECLRGHRKRTREPAARQPRLAILMTPDSDPHPSTAPAIQKFISAADSLGMDAEIITRADANRLAEFDGLFIRDTTSVNHYTYQMARQASNAGMVVIDDPDSILRCTNKVFLTELLNRHHIPVPQTVLVQGANIAEIVPALGLPCVLKKPDGAFSNGVVKVHTEEELLVQVEAMLQQSAIILAQEYLPTEYDWRVGVLDKRAIFVCRYYMAHNHWQIIKHRANSSSIEGPAEAFSISEVPDDVIGTAVKAANLIGDGFYGVDLKRVGTQVYVIEINDNPNVDVGNEDGVLKDALYREIMGVFRKRIEAGKGSEK